MDDGDSLGSYLSDLESEKFSRRMRAAVTLAWRLFSRKVGDGLIEVHKEASMQLQYAYVLQQLLPLLSFHPGESFTIELENGVRLGDKRPQGGNFWVVAGVEDVAVASTLTRWGFRHRPGKGWWR